MLLHEDRPHTVPTRAYLVWKENWFFVFMDTERDLNCLVHLSTEPTRNIGHVSVSLLYGGETLTRSLQAPLPELFVHQSSFEIGPLSIDFVQPQKEIRLRFEDDEIRLDLTLQERMKLFDFLACYDVNPDALSISESTGFALGQFRHQGQSMNGKGLVEYRCTGKILEVEGLGYRDHSWGMRDDQITLSHNWTFVNFPDKAFHLFTKRNVIRSELELKEGYVGVAEGNTVLKSLTVEYSGEGPEKLPAEVRFVAVDVDNRKYTIVADVKNSFARLPLLLQKAGGKGYYCVDNFCKCRLEETGEKGFPMSR